MREISLGLEKDLVKLPKEIKIDRDYFYLLKDDEEYRLVSRECPHAGALVDAEDGELVCYMHGWCFDIRTGACINVPSRALTVYPVITKDGELFAQI